MNRKWALTCCTHVESKPSAGSSNIPSWERSSAFAEIPIEHRLTARCAQSIDLKTAMPSVVQLVKEREFCLAFIINTKSGDASLDIEPFRTFEAKIFFRQF